MLFDNHGNPTLPDAAKADTLSRVGENRKSAVEDVHVPFPAEWLADLRRISPVTTLHSWLLPFYYRARERWTLYDVLPDACIPHDETPVAPGFTGTEYYAVMDGPRPSEAPEWLKTPFVTDVQHEMHRVYGGYARPFWVLQGSVGGHQVHFSPWQQNVLISKNLNPEAPGIGDLPFAPFDGRSVKQLTHLNRLHQFENQMERLRDSGSRAFAEAESEKTQREIREAEYDFVCNQMEPIVDMSMSLVRGQNPRSEHEDQIVRVKDGVAAEAEDAIQEYLATGNFSLGDIGR